MLNGISSTLNLHKSIGTDWTWTHNLSHRKQKLYWLSWLDCAYGMSFWALDSMIMHVLMLRHYIYLSWILQNLTSM